MKKICLHHLDFDGKAAGAIVKSVHPDCQMIEMQYRTPVPFDVIGEDDEIFIVDFSLEPEVMVELLEITKNVCWIDHHESSIKKYDGFEGLSEADIDGIREIGKSGCLLAWEWFYPHQEVPWPVILINDWDVYTLKYGVMTKEFYSGLMCYETSPDDKIWKKLLEEFKHPRETGTLTRKIIDQGHIIEKFRKQTELEYLRTWGYLTIFDEHTAFAVNKAKASTKEFELMEDVDVDLLISYVFDGHEYTISLRTTKEDIDCAEIAERYGGGGHKGASGFRDKVLPFVAGAKDAPPGPGYNPTEDMAAEDDGPPEGADL